MKGQRGGKAVKENKELESLIDISNIKIDVSMAKEDRIKDFIEKIKNPYCFKVGDVIVKSSFKENTGTLQKKMEQYFEAAIM